MCALRRVEPGAARDGHGRKGRIAGEADEGAAGGDGAEPGVWAPGVDRDGIALAVKREFSGLVYAGVRRSGFGAMELYVVQATPARRCTTIGRAWTSWRALAGW